VTARWVKGCAGDPRDGGQPGRLGAAVAEAGGVGGVGGVEDLAPAVPDRGGGAEVHGGRRVVGDAGVAVVVVLAREEPLAERTPRDGVKDSGT